MNGRRAKVFRRIARGMTVGSPEVKYRIEQRPPRQVTGPDPMSPTGFRVVGFTHRDTTHLRRGCTREVTQRMKRLYKEAIRG